MENLFVKMGAEFSPCRAWRYLLWRIWDKEKPMLQVIGLNPSTADESKDDPTVRKCQGYARAWGYGGLYMTNLFGFRATDPTVMKAAAEPIGELNDFYLLDTAKRSGLVLAAWGNHGAHREREQAVRALIPNLHCLKINEATGMPAHPLYLKGSLQPIPYSRKS